MCAHTIVSTREHIHARTPHTHACTHTHTHARTHARPCTHKHIPTHIHTICHAHIAHTHTRIHARTHALPACRALTNTRSRARQVMYGRVDDASGEQIAQDFCPNAVKPVKREKTKYVPPVSAKERAKTDPASMMTEMLKTRDTSGVISEMLEMEASFPERMLDAALQKEIVLGSEQLACVVCKAAVRQAHSRVKGVAKTPAFKDKWQRQALVAEAITHICHGKDWERLQIGYYPTVPGNPPEWAADYFVVKLGGEFKLKKGKASIATMKEFIKAVSPPAQDGAASDAEDEADEDFEKSRGKHEYDVMRQAIIRTACKSAIDHRLDTEDGDLSELLLEKIEEPAKNAANTYCQPVCGRQRPSDEL